jgi:hypothetical protein
MKAILCWIEVLGFLLTGLTPALAQSANAAGPASLDATQIVAQLMTKNQQRAALLGHWEGCRHYAIDYAGFPSGKSAEMVVEVKFDAPSKKQFRIVSEGGSHLLINRVLKELLVNEKEALGEENRIKTALAPDNYEFRLEGSDNSSDRPQYVLEVTPLSANKYLYRGKIWVDAADFAVTRISAEPAKNPSVWINHTAIEHRYSKIGNFWLPASNTSVSKLRLGGTAKLRIDYLNYRIGVSKTAPATDVCSSAPREVQVSGAQ